MAQRASVRWGIAVVAIALTLIEARLAPLVLAATTLIATASFLWARRSKSDRRSQRTARRRRAIELTALVSVGLWLGVFLVLRTADAGDSTIVAGIPVTLDGHETSASGVFIHGLLSSTALISALISQQLWSDARSKSPTGRNHRTTQGKSSKHA